MDPDLNKSIAGNRLAALSNGILDILFRKGMEDLDLSPAQVSVLVLVDYMPGISIEECRSALSLSHSYLVRLVESLQNQGLIEKSKRDSDKRAIHLDLTEEGKKRINLYHTKREKAMEEIMGLLGADQQRALEDITNTLLAYFPEGEKRSAQICRYCEMRPCHLENCPVGLGDQFFKEGKFHSN